MAAGRVRPGRLAVAGHERPGCSWPWRARSSQRPAMADLAWWREAAARVREKTTSKEAGATSLGAHAADHGGFGLVEGARGRPW